MKDFYGRTDEPKVTMKWPPLYHPEAGIFSSTLFVVDIVGTACSEIFPLIFVIFCLDFVDWQK